MNKHVLARSPVVEIALVQFSKVCLFLQPRSWVDSITTQLKSVHYKKTIALISFLSKLWYFLFWFVLKVPQFWKKRDLRNCLVKMNGLWHYIIPLFFKIPKILESIFLRHTDESSNEETWVSGYNSCNKQKFCQPYSLI
jgi:hypothetical protein